MKVNTNVKAVLLRGEPLRSSCRNFLQAAAMSLSPVLVVLSLMLTAPGPAHAITHCHDYVYSVISGGQDSNGLQIDGIPTSTSHVNRFGLRNQLLARGYVKLPVVLTGQANESDYLRDGDVVIFVPAVGGLGHSGVVVYAKDYKSGKETPLINHFMQKFGHSGVPYSLAQAVYEWDPTLNTGLLRRKWLLNDIREFRYNIPGLVSPPPAFKNMPMEVWRPGAQQLMLDWKNNDLCLQAEGGCTMVNFTGYGVLSIGYTHFIPVPSTLGVNDNWLQGWRLISMEFQVFDPQFHPLNGLWLYLAINTANPSIRYVNVWEPNARVESGWKQAYNLHQIW